MRAEEFHQIGAEMPEDLADTGIVVGHPLASKDTQIGGDGSPLTT